MIHAESAGHRACLILRFLVLIGAGAITVVLLEFWSEATPRFRTRGDLRAAELGLVWDRMAGQVLQNALQSQRGPTIIQNPPTYNYFGNPPANLQQGQAQGQIQSAPNQPQNVQTGQTPENQKLVYKPQQANDILIKEMNDKLQQNSVQVSQQSLNAAQNPAQNTAQISVQNSQAQSSNQQAQPNQEQTCEPIKGIVFLKTHKTGSSTMTNIIMRHADKYNRTIGLPLQDKWELGGYPSKIDKRLIQPPLDSYEVLSHHFRLDLPNMPNIVKPGTKAITIIREPVGNVESAFGFYRDQKPFTDWMPDVSENDRIEKFYENPGNWYNTDTDWFYRAKNQMMFDLGYNVSRDDDTYIATAISELDNYFDLVLLTDFFDESLILLKDMMCWGWEDIVYIKFKMRTEEAKSTITETLSERIKVWNKADVQMYDHFNQTFWRKVDVYGKDRLYQDLTTFQEEIKKAEKKCIERYEPFRNKPWLLHAKLRRTQSPMCRKLSWSELVYSERLQTQMYKMVPGVNKPSKEEKADLIKLFDEVQAAAFRHG